MHSGASGAFLTSVQVPVAQLLHASVQALLQQTPSLQNPLAHSPAAPQTAPFAFREERRGPRPPGQRPGGRHPSG